MLGREITFLDLGTALFCCSWTTTQKFIIIGSVVASLASDHRIWDFARARTTIGQRRTVSPTDQCFMKARAITDSKS
jgi:hypothetical protein